MSYLKTIIGAVCLADTGPQNPTAPYRYSPRSKLRAATTIGAKSRSGHCAVDHVTDETADSVADNAPDLSARNGANATANQTADKCANDATGQFAFTTASEAESTVQAIISEINICKHW
ncbi:hypothetical protein [Nitratireductor sp.]|uniref:hypothetical protein n=1 Tax=Nitratireductor sp. TaxID=1872084 RepID=UPI00262E470C|nr:hypothetical protein [Nitratireductor sp.]MCV0378034.1 hypothetical protein [Nitratireductor sp.]